MRPGMSSEEMKKRRIYFLAEENINKSSKNLLFEKLRKNEGIIDRLKEKLESWKVLNLESDTVNDFTFMEKEKPNDPNLQIKKVLSCESIKEEWRIKRGIAQINEKQGNFRGENIDKKKNDEEKNVPKEEYKKNIEDTLPLKICPESHDDSHKNIESNPKRKIPITQRKTNKENLDFPRKPPTFFKSSVPLKPLTNEISGNQNEGINPNDISCEKIIVYQITPEKPSKKPLLNPFENRNFTERKKFFSQSEGRNWGTETKKHTRNSSHFKENIPLTEKTKNKKMTEKEKKREILQKNEWDWPKDRRENICKTLREIDWKYQVLKAKIKKESIY